MSHHVRANATGCTPGTGPGGATTLTARCDRRFRLPDALDAVLAAPVLTPKALARQLALSPQAATRLLATLAETGVIREITGRTSFRAFAV